MAAAISAAWVSSAKCPVSKKRTTASGMSRLTLCCLGPTAPIAGRIAEADTGPAGCEARVRHQSAQTS